ncbi:MAG: hypothetical protein IH872_07335 [Chloroflexi bacterium]|nr:hypothetical protein [Chloroflexota bacterium]
MKPKLAAILVIGILTLSIAATAVAAIGQAVAEDPGASSIALGSYTNEIGDTNDQGALATAFFKVCPFH